MARLSRPLSTVIIGKSPDGGTQKWLPGPEIHNATTPPPKPQVISTNAGTERQKTYWTAQSVFTKQTTPRVPGQTIQCYNRADGGTPAQTTTAQPVVVTTKAPQSKAGTTASSAPAEVYMGPIYIQPAIPRIPVKYQIFTTFTFIAAAEKTPAAQVVVTRPSKMVPGKFIFKVGTVGAPPPEVGPDAPITCGPTGVFGTDRSTGDAGIVRTTAVVGTSRSTRVAGTGRSSGTGGTARIASTAALNVRETDTSGASRTSRVEDPC